MVSIVSIRRVRTLETRICYIHSSFIHIYRIIQQSHPSFNNVMLIGVMLCLLAIIPLGEFYLHEKQIYETHDVCCLLWGRPWRQVCHSHSVPSGLWYWDLASHPGVHPGLWCHVQQSLESPLDGIQKQGGPTSTRDQGKLTICPFWGKICTNPTARSTRSFLI